jgi:hypothetical protein
MRSIIDSPDACGTGMTLPHVQVTVSVAASAPDVRVLITRLQSGHEISKFSSRGAASSLGSAARAVGLLQPGFRGRATFHRPRPTRLAFNHKASFRTRSINALAVQVLSGRSADMIQLEDHGVPVSAIEPLQRLLGPSHVANRFPAGEPTIDRRTGILRPLPGQLDV